MIPSELMKKRWTKRGRAFGDITNENRRKVQRSTIQKQKKRNDQHESFQRRRTEDAGINIVPFVDDYVITDHQFTGKIRNIDEHDKHDALYVTDYINDLYLFFHQKENAGAARQLNFENQPEIDATTRRVFVRWIKDASKYFELASGTLYLSLNILDRYLERKGTPRAKMQLLAASSLLIACKFGDVRRCKPTVRELMYICDDVSRTEIVNMEAIILETLDYDIYVPTSYTFLTRYLKAACIRENANQLAYRVLENTLESSNLLCYLPSQLAAAVICIARYSTGFYAWSATLVKYTGYLEKDIIPIARAVLRERQS